MTAAMQLVMRVPRHDVVASIPADQILGETPIFAVGAWRPRGYFGGRAGTLLCYPSGIAWFPASFLRGYGFTAEALGMGAEIVGLGLGDIGHRLLHEAARRRHAATSDADRIRRGMSRNRSLVVPVADIVEISSVRQRRLTLHLVDAAGARQSTVLSSSRPTMAAVGERIAILRFTNELRFIDPALVAGDVNALGPALRHRANDGPPDGRAVVSQLLTDYATCEPVVTAFPGVFSA